ncbi:hypothetical protein [Cupriavidus sp. AU9028]|uniref:hypothetical protein n=1 Tax=Cupriavidus sp. AU9028 TaxID=2871157 RepID=UPI001C978B0D|nr:hypothetical protein [Cupriavidus sp. AU9028]MBY4896005.1 hypothetical protein [Cupriavidus sp. AU9028]
MQNLLVWHAIPARLPPLRSVRLSIMGCLQTIFRIVAWVWPENAGLVTRKNGSLPAESGRGGSAANRTGNRRENEGGAPAIPVPGRAQMLAPGSVLQPMQD